MSSALKVLKLIIGSSLLLSGCDFSEQNKPVIPEHIGVKPTAIAGCKGAECDSKQVKVKFYDLKQPDSVSQNKEQDQEENYGENATQLPPEIIEAIRVNTLIEKKKRKAEKDLLEARENYEKYSNEAVANFEGLVCTK